MILEKGGVTISPTEPVKNRRKYWLNITSNEMYQLVDGKYEKLEKSINIVIGQEVETGKTINGRIEYQKRINVGDLPNNSSLVVSTGLSNVHWSRPPEGFAQNKESQANIMPLPYIDPRDNSASISLSLISEYRIAVVTRQDRSSFYGIVDVFYTKDTD